MNPVNKAYHIITSLIQQLHSVVTGLLAAKEFQLLVGRRNPLLVDTGAPCRTKLPSEVQKMQVQAGYLQGEKKRPTL